MIIFDLQAIVARATANALLAGADAAGAEARLRYAMRGETTADIERAALMMRSGYAEALASDAARLRGRK